MRLNFYSAEELERIVSRGASLLAFDLNAEGASEIARRSRGTPRRRARRARQEHRVGADVRADVEDGRPRLDDLPEQGDFALGEFTVEIQRPADIDVGRVI